MKPKAEYALEFLLEFDGRRHWYEGGYCVRFEIRRVPPDAERPYGIKYSLTLHAPDGKRLIGFDNAHRVRLPGSRFKRRSAMADHWHGTAKDPGRPYAFKNAERLIDDFFDAVEQVLTERGVPFDVISDDDGS